MPAGLHRANPNVIVIHEILFEHPILRHLPEPFMRIVGLSVVFKTVCRVTAQRGGASFVEGRNMVAYAL